MEQLFQSSTLLVFFFASIAIFNYTDFKIEQRLSIIYISVYALVATGIIGLKLAYLFLFLTLFAYLEIFTQDAMKLKLLVNPIYKVIDCTYLSIAQYYLMYILLSLFCFYYKLEFWIGEWAYILKIFSIIPLFIGITKALRQKYVIKTFQEMYRVFSLYPIHKVQFNQKLHEACCILVDIEDRNFYARKSYSFLSIRFLFSALKHKKRPHKHNPAVSAIRNITTLSRGYSTIPMQLIRSLGIKYGYNCVFRRKIYEILYSRMFFSGVKRLMHDEHVSNRKYFNEYLLYIYFHSVTSFLGDAVFSKFLNAFDMRGPKKNVKDIYDCSNEGIFIACMGLSKRANKINKDNIDYYLKPIQVSLDRNEILNMVSIMMDKPYENNYLK